MASKGVRWAIWGAGTLCFLVSPVGAQITEAGGVAIFEAEDFVTNLSARSGHDWSFSNAVSGFGGIGYMEATPNTGSNIAGNSSSPELQFTVNFNATGTHYIWVRGFGASVNDDSVHVGIDGGSPVPMTLSQTNAWQWTNTIQGAAGAAAINVSNVGSHLINVWMREDGFRIDRVLLTTAPNFAAHTGNAWHIANSAEATGGATMRSPLVVNAGDSVKIYNGSQFQGNGDPGNQLQTGSTVFYRKATDAMWSSAAMTFSSMSGNNKFYMATLPPAAAGQTYQYYLKVPFSDHLPTFIYGTDSQSNMTEVESVARANAFTFAVQTPVHAGNTTLNLPADLPAASGYTTENALGALTFAAPIAIVSPPGETNRLFVVERGGTIQVVNNLTTTPTKQKFLDLPAYLSATGGGSISTDSEQGLLGLAFHPNYAQNGYFYVFYSVAISEGGGTKVFERVAVFGFS
ncbi:MAG: PQQ-dependent sugar dehydrogenase [Chthoniobacterales bacterium]